MPHDSDGWVKRNHSGAAYKIVRKDDGELYPESESFDTPTLAELQSDYSTAVDAGEYADWSGFAKRALGLTITQRISDEYINDTVISNLAQYCMLIGIVEVELPASYIQVMWGKLLLACATAGFQSTATERAEWNNSVDEYRLGSSMYLQEPV